MIGIGTIMTMLGLAVLAIGIVAAIPALADMATTTTTAPLKQWNGGTPLEEIRCRGQMVLMEIPGGGPACVTQATSQKLEQRGWNMVSRVTEPAAGENEPATTRDRPASVPDDQQVESQETKDVEISTNTVTLVGGQAANHTEETTAPLYGGQPWTTLTYPEEFRIGEPFTINYTWTYLQSYSEADGDEWPQDNLEKYPWAQEWSPYQEGEDEDGNVWWTILSGYEVASGYESTGGPKVIIWGNDMMKVLTPEFGPRDPHGMMYFPPLEGRLNSERIHPWDLEKHSESITLRFDEPVLPPNHLYVIDVGLNDVYSFYVHFNDGRGYLGTEYMRWFAQDISGAAALVEEEDLPNPLHCISNAAWESNYSTEQKKYEYMYPSGRCDGKSLYSPPINATKAEMIEGAITNYKDWIDRNGITENIKEYLENTLGATSDEINGFFEKYPHLKGLFVLPSTSFFLPDAYATHGNDHLLVARGTFLVSDTAGNPVSPVGASVCLYDQRNNGTYAVLKNGPKDACIIMSDSGGTYVITAVNTDPDDNTGADLTVGLKAENDIIKVVDYDTQTPNTHGDGDIIKAHAPTSDIVNNLPKNRDQIIKLPSVTLGSNSEFSRSYYFIAKIFDASKYMKDHLSTDISQVTVEYDLNITDHGRHYHRGDNTISLDADYYNRDYTILHEYGHHAMKSVYVNDNNGDFPNSPGGPHSINLPHDSHELVWSEGWANYFPTLVTGNSTFAHGDRIYNFEDRNFDNPSQRITNQNFDSGDLVEGNIAAVLWDLTDGKGERNGTRGALQDNISNLKRNVWDVLDTPAPSSTTAPQETFAEFITHGGISTRSTTSTGCCC